MCRLHHLFWIVFFSGFGATPLSFAEQKSEAGALDKKLYALSYQAFSHIDGEDAFTNNISSEEFAKELLNYQRLFEAILQSQRHMQSFRDILFQQTNESLRPHDTQLPRNYLPDQDAALLQSMRKAIAGFKKSRDYLNNQGKFYPAHVAYYRAEAMKLFQQWDWFQLDVVHLQTLHGSYANMLTMKDGRAAETLAEMDKLSRTIAQIGTQDQALYRPLNKKSFEEWPNKAEPITPIKAKGKSSLEKPFRLLCIRMDQYPKLNRREQRLKKELQQLQSNWKPEGFRELLELRFQAQQLLDQLVALDEKRQDHLISIVLLRKNLSGLIRTALGKHENAPSDPEKYKMSSHYLLEQLNKAIGKSEEMVKAMQNAEYVAGYFDGLKPGKDLTTDGPIGKRLEFVAGYFKTLGYLKDGENLLKMRREIISGKSLGEYVKSLAELANKAPVVGRSMAMALDLYGKSIKAVEQLGGRILNDQAYRLLTAGQKRERLMNRHFWLKPEVDEALVRKGFMEHISDPVEEVTTRLQINRIIQLIRTSPDAGCKEYSLAQISR